jgi:prolyl oligopeptidase
VRTAAITAMMSALMCACGSPLSPSRTTTMNNAVATTDDPYLWLEDVEGERALTWVREQNARTTNALASNDGFRSLQQSIRLILDADTRIPSVQKIGPYLYNFWQDREHERGIWRRTTLDDYRNKAEGKAWVWKGASCLRPEYRRCLVDLSPGGGDATVTREFDLETRRWVDGGFERPLAKGELRWIDRDTVFVATDFGPGSMTTSGYARIVKRWARGTPMSAATMVFEAAATDLGVWAWRDHTPGFERSFVQLARAFYDDELHWVAPDGRTRKIDVPNHVRKSVHREWLLLRPREDWSVAGKTLRGGSLVATRFDDLMRGELRFDVLFEPTPSRSLVDVDGTRGQIAITTLDDVKSRVTLLTPGAQGWQSREAEGLPRFGNVSVAPLEATEGDELWISTADFLTPPQLLLMPRNGAADVVKSTPSFFDASKHEVQQHFATSKDGTRVPYFLVLPTDTSRGRALDGTIPTLMNGYGGFEVSNTPHYSGGIGKGWIEQGGAYVLTNIRGGGEYGPAWHQAALKANRHRAYEDFAAIAQDLVARKVTSAQRLAAMGGSNGGLLMGNMLVGYPQSFGALSIEVPLLDMRRYNKLLAGASWMAEYGDPDKPDEWAFIRTFSPYQLFDAARTYPPTLILTSTKDDRVHPGHARKMAAKMLAAGKDVHDRVYYYENIEGGHAGAANNEQTAFMAALRYRFLWGALTSAAR